jgi:hypothetical protein
MVFDILLHKGRELWSIQLVSQQEATVFLARTVNSLSLEIMPVDISGQTCRIKVLISNLTVSGSASLSRVRLILPSPLPEVELISIIPFTRANRASSFDVASCSIILGSALIRELHMYRYEENAL